MDVRAIPRAALGAYLKAVRLPLDLALRAAGGDGRAALAVDRVDAAVRDLAGRVTADGELRRDARRRRVAADARERAATSASPPPAPRPSALPAGDASAAADGADGNGDAQRKLAQAARRRRAIKAMAAVPPPA